VGLSTKRQRELDALRLRALHLWEAQQHVLDQANVVAQEAGRQAGHLTREEVLPRARAGYDHYVRPVTRAAGDVISNNVVPAVGTVLGTAMSVTDVAHDTRVRAALNRLQGVKAEVVKPAKKKVGFGTVLLIAVGTAAAAGLAYAVWQTFRADDELWVADDDPSSPAAE
jgi:hypothetical protein